MPNVENGLFSRFLLLRLALREEWKDVFAKEVGCESDDEVFAEFGRRFFRFYKHLCDLDDEVKFVLTRAQEEQFNHHFAQLQAGMIDREGYDMVASVRRLGLITFRLAMILSVLRLEGEEIDSCRQLICSSEDFDVAMEMTKALVTHAVEVYHEMGENAENANAQGGVKLMQKRELLSRLDNKFALADAIVIGREMSLSERTINSYLREMVAENIVKRVKHGMYEKNL
jgi:hypothetical protein